ncbi:MAG TPA: Ig-like domain-containing protein [Bacteroidia bacterium]|nr:Ig-like domain-containing protein [Bacteroidia bacterium]
MNQKFFLSHCLCFCRQLIFTSVLFLLFSCANRVIPSGGEKDVIPPKIISSSPENYSVNFDKKEIEVEFDEFIQLTDLNKQLIISPLIDPLPEITTNKKSLRIKFDNPLKENTTYTFNFGSAIADVHEKNIFENFLLVFSTGDYLDSLSVSGKVVNAENLVTEKGILVMLYNENEDSVPYKKVPDYFAKTDSSGKYEINNISSGSFKIFALKDKNSNYLYDTPDETIAFSDSLVVMSDSAKKDLKLFTNPPGKIRLKNSLTEERGRLRLNFNSRAEDITVKAISIEKKPWQLEEYSTGKDTLILWMSDTTLDSMKVALLQNEQPFDTALFVLKRNSSGKGLPGKTFLFSSNVSAGTLDPGKEPMLMFTHPVEHTDESKIIFRKDSVISSGVKINFSDSVKRNLVMKYNWKENEHYELIFLPGAFKDIFNVENDTAKFSFRLKPVTEFGSVLLKIKTDEKSANYIVQLVNDKDQMIREKNITSSGVINFEFLIPGTYQVKIIYDDNKNNRWDAGNYLKKIQPENVVYYKEKITVRANWDLEQEWDLKK